MTKVYCNAENCVYLDKNATICCLKKITIDADLHDARCVSCHVE